MASYILRAFDKELAATGFKCIMLTGSHFVGSVIDDTDADIKGMGMITVDAFNNVCKLVVDGTTYCFKYSGECITSGCEQYRLMLADNKASGSMEEILTNIYGALAAINATIGKYCSETDKKLTDLSDAIEQVAASIPDVSNLVTKDNFDALEARVKALEDAQPEPEPEPEPDNNR